MRALSIFLAALLVGASAWTFGGAQASTFTPAREELMDCTFNVKGNFGGSIVDVTITVSNVSGLECLLLKAGVKAAINKQ